MYAYHTDLILTIDKILFSFLIFLVFSIVFYALAKEYFWKKRSRVSLLNIKKDVYEAVLTGKHNLKSASTATAGQFLDVVTNRNRDFVFFNESEQKLFRDCFISAKRIARLGHLSNSKSGNKWKRVEAILSLGYSQDISALEILEKTILDKDEDIVYFSMLALGQIKNVQSARILIELLKRNEFVRFKIASILESFPAAIVSEISQLLKSEAPSVRFWALKILSKLRPAEFIKDVEGLTSDDSEEVRAAACECLGEIGAREAKDTLLRCLKDDSWLVRVNAIKAFAKIFSKECLPEVMQLINDGSLSVIDAVKDVMAEYIETALPYIEKFFAGEDGLAKRVSVEVLETSNYVAKMFKDILSANEKDKQAAIKLLSGMISSHARFGLDSALNNFDEDSRNKLLSVIKDITNKYTDKKS